MNGVLFQQIAEHTKNINYECISEECIECMMQTRYNRSNELYTGNTCDSCLRCKNILKYNIIIEEAMQWR